MNSMLILSPAAGAVIGYFTNYVAIKMLFRPYKPIKFAGVNLPFTPGLIPKERERIAKALGEAVGKQILTEDTLRNSLLKKEMLAYIGNTVASFVEKAEERHADLGEVVSYFIGDKYDLIKEKLSEVLYDEIHVMLNSDDAKNMISEKVLSLLVSLKQDERKINEIISVNTAEELKLNIAKKVPDIARGIIAFTDNADTEEMLKQKVRGALVSIAGPIMGMFINADDIYLKIKNGIRDYFENEENLPEIRNFVDNAFDMFCEKSIADTAGMTKGFLSEEKTKSVIAYMIEKTFGENSDGLISKDMITGILNKLMEIEISDLLSKVQMNKENISSAAENIYKNIVLSVSDKFINNLDMSSIVEEKINSFDIAFLEKLIVSIAKKELSAITYLGGVLGFIIGFVPAILNMI